MTRDWAEECGAELVFKDDLFRRSDYVVVIVIQSDRTIGLVGAHEFGLMKPDAYLINPARGPIVDEAALVEALSNGEIGAAALDVFEREPEVHPGLLGLDNAVLVPHLGSATVETRTAMATLAARNVVGFFDGSGPATPVT